MNSIDPRARLARATTGDERRRAVSTALAEGMPLNEIDDYLDWIDAMRADQSTQVVRSGRSWLARCLRLVMRRRRDLSGE